MTLYKNRGLRASPEPKFVYQGQWHIGVQWLLMVKNVQKIPLHRVLPFPSQASAWRRAAVTANKKGQDISVPECEVKNGRKEWKGGRSKQSSRG